MNPSRFRTRRRVEFCETDAAGIVHFASFLCYMEQAEHEFWRHVGTSVIQKSDDGWHLSWPRVHVSCDYRGMARFEDELDIYVGLQRLGTKSVTYQFEFSRGPESIADGQITAVCCRFQTGHSPESIAIPATLRDKLQPYLMH